MPKISRSELIRQLAIGALQELSAFRIEFKAKWDKDFGQDISAIANHVDRQGGWLIVGVNDEGILLKKNKDWAKKEEAKISSHITTFLNPDFTVVDITAEDVNNSWILIIEIRSPDDVVYWDSKSYKLVGTSSKEMQPDEILSLSIKLLKRWATVAIIDGQISKAFTAAEENNLREFLNYYSYRSNSEGNISNSEARELIGLSNSDVERKQLSRLFKKWRDDGLVESVKRGEWRFITKPG